MVLSLVMLLYSLYNLGLSLTEWCRSKERGGSVLGDGNVELKQKRTEQNKFLTIEELRSSLHLRSDRGGVGER